MHACRQTDRQTNRQTNRQTDRQPDRPPPYLPTYLHTYIPTYLPTYLHTYIYIYSHIAIGDLRWSQISCNQLALRSFVHHYSFFAAPSGEVLEWTESAIVFAIYSNAGSFHQCCPAEQKKVLGLFIARTVFFFQSSGAWHRCRSGLSNLGDALNALIRNRTISHQTS